MERDRPLTRLTESEASQILLGEITDWSELGLPAGPINIFGLGNDIGTRDLLSELLLDGEPIPPRLVQLRADGR